ncbi:DUF503 domain-containing protein [Natronoglycomyces albus]|uniref:DUF503 domain-containing protein n=1 Tax=Natronoglycomyces albus TaxID=2811108 RepID=A0A895XSE6_9ACTN|nr:DUF503 domain-containing protein [Natronoglycomyces albus]QSB06249.1 DUF503 domain-containing protein [Natronoglycomyces albus]
MFCGTLECDLMLPSDARSLKAKRSYVRPIIASLRKYDVAVAEVGHLARHGRTAIGVAAVAADHQHVSELLDSCEHHLTGRPEVEILSVKRRIIGPEDFE